MFTLVLLILANQLDLQRLLEMLVGGVAQPM
jgi:hypothetical protein